jgi:hypothetical protein
VKLKQLIEQQRQLAMQRADINKRLLDAVTEELNECEISHSCEGGMIRIYRGYAKDSLVIKPRSVDNLYYWGLGVVDDIPCNFEQLLVHIAENLA